MPSGIHTDCQVFKRKTVKSLNLQIHTRFRVRVRVRVRARVRYSLNKIL